MTFLRTQILVYRSRIQFLNKKKDSVMIMDKEIYRKQSSGKRRKEIRIPISTII
jgi:translation elongation factor P/translation initiation factor 5A